jgi:hypothetical protein
MGGWMPEKQFWRSGGEKCFSLDIPFYRTSPFIGLSHRLGGCGRLTKPDISLATKSGHFNLLTTLENATTILGCSVSCTARIEGAQFNVAPQQHHLYLFPEMHGHGSFRPTLGAFRRRSGVRVERVLHGRPPCSCALIAVFVSPFPPK